MSLELSYRFHFVLISYLSNFLACILSPMSFITPVSSMPNVTLLSIEQVYASQQRIIMFLRIGYMYTNSISVESSMMEFLILFKNCIMDFYVLF